MRPLLAATPLPLVCAAALLTPAGCGPEHAFSGVWRQRCEAAEGDACTDPKDYPFVYKLHIGRYGGDLTGIAVRYVNIPGTESDYDPFNECGCFLMINGSATDSRVEFTLKLVKDATGGGPGCPSAGQTYNDDCRARIEAAPDCNELLFTLRGDEDSLVGEPTGCGATPEATFVPSSGKTRHACLEQEECPNFPGRGVE